MLNVFGDKRQYGQFKYWQWWHRQVELLPYKQTDNGLCQIAQLADDQGVWFLTHCPFAWAQMQVAYDLGYRTVVGDKALQARLQQVLAQDCPGGKNIDYFLPKLQGAHVQPIVFASVTVYNKLVALGLAVPYHD